MELGPAVTAAVWVDPSRLHAVVGPAAVAEKGTATLVDHMASRGVADKPHVLTSIDCVRWAMTANCGGWNAGAV